MAENETLNLKDRHSARWRALMKLVAQRPSVGEVREETVRCLYVAAKNLVELLPLGELLAAAAGDNGPVAEIVARCSIGRDYAQLFERQADRRLTRKQVMRNVFVSALDTFFDQVSFRLAPAENPWTFSSLRNFFGQVKQEGMEDIRQLAAKVASNPHEAPKMPALSEAAKEQRRRQLTDMSLLRE